MTDKKQYHRSAGCRTANILVLIGAVLFDISLAGLLFDMAQAWILFGAGAAVLAVGLSRQPQGREENFYRRLFLPLTESGNA